MPGLCGEDVLACTLPWGAGMAVGLPAWQKSTTREKAFIVTVEIADRICQRAVLRGGVR